MKEIGACMNIKEITENMKEMQKQMMQMGLIEEMIEDSMDMDDGNYFGI